MTGRRWRPITGEAPTGGRCKAERREDAFDASLPHWTLFELAGHFDISIGLTRMLVADPQAGQPGRDRVSFFIFPRSEVAPVVYDYAFQMIAGKTPDDMPDVLHETFTKTVEEARANPPDLVGPGYYALMRLDEFVTSRVVEAVVHGMDLTDALERATIATPEGLAITAEILDELLAAARSRAGRTTSPTTWSGSGRRRVASSTTTHGCRSSVEVPAAARAARGRYAGVPGNP